MGRTKRRRLSKKKQTKYSINQFDSDTIIIELNRWLKNNFWCNETKLKIVYFPQTGRGVMTTRNIDSEDIIIKVPYKLMLTYTSLENSDNFKSLILSSKERFLIYDLMSLYLLLELHLNETSLWKFYVKSLPVEFSAIWLCSEAEMCFFKDGLIIMTREERNKFEESWSRVEHLLNSCYTCQHCGVNVSHVLTRDLYIWAYNIVHTRAVYVDPDVVLENSGDDLKNHLDDEPSIALCPFLDMLNHNCNTDTQAYFKIQQDSLDYCLISNSKFKKYDQIFISYGPHDNKKLLTQYGFVLPGNENDKIDFELKDILTVLNLNPRSRQYKYICKKKLDQQTYMNYTGCSFNLTAVLFVLTNDNYYIWSTKIYSSTFSKEELCAIYILAKKLLEFKLQFYKDEAEKLSFYRYRFSRHFSLYLDYLKCRFNIVKEVIHKVIPKFVM